MQETQVPAASESPVPTTGTGVEPASSPAAQGAAMVPASSPAVKGTAVDVHKLEPLVIDALHSIYDPEIPVDIYELGLIYNVDINPEGRVAITMTLTTPACPVAGSMPGEVEKTVRMIEGVTDVVVDLVWEPTWGPAMMTEAARLQLNMY